MITLAIAAERSKEFRLHPLGFFYLQHSNQRLHVWLTEGPHCAENDRHIHSFDINSKVIVGSMRNELFQFQEAPSGTDREFLVAYEGGHSILSPTGRMGSLTMFSAFDSVAGASYFLEAGVIHRVIVTEKPCVTALKTEERGIRSLSYGRQANELPFDRRLVNRHEVDEIRNLLNGIVQDESE
jgi:hypothetical protein